jgi:hypothetical protein
MSTKHHKKQPFTYSNVVSTISLIVAVTGTGVTAYCNFLWHPEQVQVSYRLRHGEPNKAFASFVFTNNGREATAGRGRREDIGVGEAYRPLVAP